MPAHLCMHTERLEVRLANELYLIHSFVLSTPQNSGKFLVPHTLHHSDMCQGKWLGHEKSTQEREAVPEELKLASATDTAI